MNHKDGSDSLRDFRTNSRVVLLSIMAIPIGALSAVVAKVLIWLIAVITNISFFGRLSSAPITPQESHLGYWVIAVVVVGAIIIGFMARYGSEKIRGHGIPEALEAILLGRSLMQPKVAILKPLSSASLERSVSTYASGSTGRNARCCESYLSSEPPDFSKK